MQRSLETLVNLDTRFQRLNTDGQAAFQTIANWVLSRHLCKEKKGMQWGSPQYGFHSDDSDTTNAVSMDDLATGRATILSVLRLMKGIVVDMQAVVQLLVAGYSHVDSFGHAEKITHFKNRVAAFQKEIQLKSELFAGIFKVKHTADAMFYVSCWLHLPFISDEEDFDSLEF
ncbi:hypothetical protein HDU78_000128 [Chytriomyces hyalinus]|nr:hypothetical protein HDU78_000128 [Chytriomyces hyalinus]KAJ3265971.1 hypothetical protein HDU77_003061 [Chytriomyces hyalinus]